MDFNIKKYPRTPHLSGSRLQPGDEDLSQISFSEILGKNIVIEEKIDGANTAISFDADGKLLLQSRGHYLRGGGREAHYELFKLWAGTHSASFYSILGSRYIMYGEWMYAKHKLFYDMLPSYFMEFDIYDREKEVYLDTESRREMTELMPVSTIPPLASGIFNSEKDILAYLGRSAYVSDGHIERLKMYCEENGLDADDVLSTTEKSLIMEGLYIKVEEEGIVKNRIKYVRSGFSQAKGVETTSEWLHRAIIPNMLSVPFDSIFEE